MRLYAKWYIIFIPLLVLAIFLSFWFRSSLGKVEKKSCRYFTTQEEAQERYDKYINHPVYGEYVKDLDRNNKNGACEHLPKEEIRRLSL